MNTAFHRAIRYEVEYQGYVKSIGIPPGTVISSTSTRGLISTIRCATRWEYLWQMVRVFECAPTDSLEDCVASAKVREGIFADVITITSRSIGGAPWEFYPCFCRFEPCGHLRGFDEDCEFSGQFHPQFMCAECRSGCHVSGSIEKATRNTAGSMEAGSDCCGAMVVHPNGDEVDADLLAWEIEDARRTDRQPD